MDVNLRHKEDFHGGTSTATFVGVLVVKTDKDVLNHLLRDILKDATSGGWENDDYGHEDLVIEEYTKATIGARSFSQWIGIVKIAIHRQIISCIIRFVRLTMMGKIGTPESRFRLPRKILKAWLDPPRAASKACPTTATINMLYM